MTIELSPSDLAPAAAATPAGASLQLAIKRAVDVVAAGLLLALMVPLLLTLALLVKVGSPGPVLFRQRRVGRGGRTFAMWKFRTMVQDAERQTAALMAHSNDPHWLALENDPRVTRLGRVLRLTSLDELPQLWHVVTGDMSLVGPRPLIESEAVQVAPTLRHRHRVRPGLTGLWQVSGRTAVSFEEMVRLDCVYVEKWSLHGDLMVLLRTIPAVLARKGAN